MSIRRGIIPGVVAIGLMVACSPSAGPPTEPTPTASRTVVETPTPTPTPTPSPTVEGVLPDGVKPERPAALDEAPTIDGAIAVLTYYLKLYPYAQNTGDLADLRALSHPDCVFCTSVIESVEELTAGGLHSTGGSVRVESATGTEVDPGRWFAVDARTLEAASQELRADGSVAEEFPASEYTMNAAVIFENGAWGIRELSYEELAS